MDTQPPLDSFNDPGSGSGMPPIAAPPPVIPLAYATRPLEPLPSRPTAHLILVILLVIGALRAGVAYWNLYNGTGSAPGSPYNFGYVTGSYVVGPIVFAIGLAYLAWFIFRWSNLAFNLVACLLLVLMYASTAIVSNAGLVRRPRTAPNPMTLAPAVAEVDRMKAEMRAQIEESGSFEGMTSEQIKEHMSRMEVAAAGATGPEGTGLRATLNFQKRLVSLTLKIRGPIEELNKLGSINLSEVKQPNEIDHRLKLAADYRDGLTDLVELARNWRRELTTEFTKAGITIQDAQAIVRDDSRRMSPQFERTRQMYELEQAAADELVAILAIQRDAWGRWHYHETDGEKQIVFDDEMELEKYNKRIIRLDEISKEQTKLARQQLNIDK